MSLRVMVEINCASSDHFVVSSGGSGASRWDPDLLKTDVVMARNRVGRLKRELHQIKHEVANTEAGMQTLAQ